MGRGLVFKLSSFSSQDLLYIAVMSALGLATKPLVTPLIHLISAPLMIPGGSLAGGFYMMWLVLAILIVNKPGTGLMVGLVQAIVMISLGYFGSHGAVSLISYTIPGVIADFTAIIFRKPNRPSTHVLICSSANITGALIVTFLVMRLAIFPMIISVIAASVSGIIGGLLSFSIYSKLKKFNLI